MADHTEEKNSYDRPETKQQNSPGGQGPAAAPGTIDQNQDTENMEVHKHPHHVTHKKKWTEYLLEFFMLFLAVFLGFIAENVRENIAERHREKEYIISLVQDLKRDTSNLSRVMDRYALQFKQQDTLMMSFDSLDTGHNRDFLRKINWIEGFPDFIYSDATMQQLKSAGGFRLIKNKNVVDSINSYSSAVNRTYINTDELNTTQHELSNAIFGFISYHKIHTTLHSGMKPVDMFATKMDILISHDLRARETFYNKIMQFRILMATIRDINFVPLKKQAANLISFLQKEYHLKEE